MTRKLLPLLSLLAFHFSLFAQTNAPKYSNEFLSIGVGARGLAMAGAQVAMVDDATSAFWNPAGLSLAKGDRQLALMHAEYFAGIAKYDYGTFCAPIDATRTIGVTIIRFAVDDIPDSLDLVDADGNIDYDRLRSFSVSNYAFLFSYSKRAKIEGLRYGGNVKVIHQKVGKFAKAWGFGIDLGIQYDYKKWKFGLFGKDITSTFNAWTFNTESFEDVFIKTGNEIPANGLELTLPKAIAGLAYKFNIGKRFSVTPALDLDVTFDGRRNVPFRGDPISIDPHMGIEIAYQDFLFLRGGANNIQQVKDYDNSKSTTVQPNMGVGVRIKNVTIDYALTNIGNAAQTLYSNVFSLKWNINIKHKPKADQTKS
jgi:hypothetical protein